MHDVVIMSGHTCCILKDRLRNRYVRHILDKIFYKLRDLKYDDKQKRYVVDNCYYRFSSRMAVGIIPKAFEPMLLELLKQNNVTYEYQLIKEPPVRKVDFNILPQWQDKPGQTEAIDFLLNSPNSMRCLALQTGGGKSFTAIKTAILRKMPFLIITSGLVVQWENYVKQYTDLENEDIYVIRGAKSFDKLMKLEYKPTAIIASLETIRNFAQEKEEYQDMGYSLMDVISHLGIGTKINDECHNNFFAVVSIDLAMNVPVNIYLSATFIRKNPSTKQIFNAIFPFSERYGEGNYTPYADICVFSYHSNVPEKAFVMAGGYAHYRYENYIFKEEKRAHWWLSRIVKPILDMRYISIKKPGERTLVIMTKVEYIMKAVEKLQSFYPNLKVLSYVGDDEETNLEADIIVSTIGSAGEGLDVPDLVHVLNTVSIASEVRILQLLGRLRKLKNSQVYMSDVYNTACDAHKRHIEERASIYRVKGKWFNQRQLTF